MKIQTITAFIMLTLLCSGMPGYSEINNFERSINITLDGNDKIQLPNLNFINPEVNWSIKSSQYPIFQKDQRLSGIIIAPNRLSGSELRLCIVNFDINMLLNKFEHPRAVKCRWIARMNNSSAGRFEIPNIRNGFYYLFVFDENNSTLLAADPIIVNSLSMTIDTSNVFKPGSPISVIIKTPLKPVERKRLYAAILVSEKEFTESRLIVSKNSSSERLIFTAKVGDNSIKMENLPVISPDFLASLINMFPRDSAFAAIESNQSDTELFLITDPSWKSGRYILTAAIFDIERGLIQRDQEMDLLGLKQKDIEIK
jgi:hypothetical protein